MPRVPAKLILFLNDLPASGALQREISGSYAGREKVRRKGESRATEKCAPKLVDAPINPNRTLALVWDEVDELALSPPRAMMWTVRREVAPLQGFIAS
jgi:hypothetical protein